jgi:hypothetical protein
LEGDDIGKIHELMIDMSYGRVAYAVLQFGGVMGLGDKLFAIPWEAFSAGDDSDEYVLNVDKEVLKDAKGFDKDDWPKTADYRWLDETYDFYGYEPYW